MNYQEALSFLFEQLPMFQRIGPSAFKKDLGNTLKMLDYLGNPHHSFPSVHIAGTNGKGSSAHMLASVLQEEGYKTGLYTSPHLKSFTERIRVNGEEAGKDYVTNFVNEHQDFILELKPSFFEITVAMAFDFFAKSKVDIAVVEVGMGGRLDSTNVLLPVICLITSIGMDHQQFLGDTLDKIAFEKAGIIKTGIPVVIGDQNDELWPLIKGWAQERKAPIRRALNFVKGEWNKDQVELQFSGEKIIIQPDLKGKYQLQNILGVWQVLHWINELGFPTRMEKRIKGFEKVIGNTGLLGRWQVKSLNPKIILDTGHNEDGLREVADQLRNEDFRTLHVVWGSVNDKNFGKMLSMMPKDANYYFCEPDIPRKLEVSELVRVGKENGLKFKAFKRVSNALEAAQKQASEEDLIFVGGSTFVVAQALD